MELVLPKPGKYVVAVSGGVDSMVLLDILSKQPGLELTVTHFDHGIRPDSAADREFVERAAKDYGLPFVYEEGRLGPAASEAKAREARYDFLRKVQKDSGARAVVTAHHQDDLLETVIINLIRGTGRKGLTALRSRPGLSRPLLKIPKQELLSYAREHGLEWREDPTNQELGYLRNYVRHKILPRFSDKDRQNLLDLVTRMVATNTELDSILQGLLDRQAADKTLDRQWFNQLPHASAREVMAAWLRANGAAGFDRQTLERLVVAAKTGRPGKLFPVYGGLNMRVLTSNLALDDTER